MERGVVVDSINSSSVIVVGVDLGETEGVASSMLSSDIGVVVAVSSSSSINVDGRADWGRGWA